MIRRLPHGGVLESITPRPVSGGHAVLAAGQESLPPADEMDTQAYRQGYAEGFEAGEQDGRREAEQYQQAWEEQTRQRMDEEYQALVRERENFVAVATSMNEQLQAHGDAMERLAFEVAFSSLARAIGAKQADGELLLQLCRQMAEEYRGKVVRLEVSAADRSCLPEHLDGLEIAVEHGLSLGECRIVTLRGYAQSSIVARMASIHEAMREALGVSSP